MLMRDETIIAVVAMACIALVLVIALFKEVNGTLLATGMAIIAGLAGYKLKGLREAKPEPEK